VLLKGGRWVREEWDLRPLRVRSNEPLPGCTADG
jgi:hypothetical protein